jgi:hypothetical protein
MLSWLALVTTAMAAPDEGSVRGPRTVQVDVFLLDPRTHVWGTDWKITLLEQWTAVLACAPATPTVERCRFVDGTRWTVIVADQPDKAVTVLLPAPGEIEFSWTPRGRLKTWDVVGDRSDFWTKASNAMLKHTYHRSDVVFRPDAQRQIGQDIEGSLTRQLAAALEWELPKVPPADGLAWEPTQTPWIGRRWTTSTANARLSYKATADQGALAFTMDGIVKEQNAETGSMPAIVTTTVVGAARWDPAVGGVVQARFETKAEPSGAWTLVGHARSVALVQPWTEGSAVAPSGLPDLRLQ